MAGHRPLAARGAARYHNAMMPLYREEQLYRELPPFTLLVIVGTLFGWLLVIWAGLLGRPIGQADLPVPVALAIGLPFGLILPLAYGRLSMTTEVFADRIVVHNGMSSNLSLPLANVVDVVVRTDDIRGDYNIRNIGAVANTRTAFVVAANQGVQLEVRDGRLFLIGSQQPEALAAALAAARGPVTAAVERG